jgi:hypothetical protein
MCDICTKLYTARTYSFLFRSNSSFLQGTVQRDFDQTFHACDPMCTCSCCCGLFSIMAVPENCRFVPTGLLYLVLNKMLWFVSDPVGSA